MRSILTPVRNTILLEYWRHLAFHRRSSGDTLAAITIPNSFFLNNPLGMEFTPTPDGSLVSLHLSQSFGYSVVGGSGNFPAPAELGDATIGSPSAVPEPGSFTLLGLGAAGIMVGSLRKRFVRA